MALRREMDTLFDDFFRGIEMEPSLGRWGNGDSMTFNPRVSVAPAAGSAARFQTHDGED